jgi:hypothetical protein
VYVYRGAAAASLALWLVLPSGSVDAGRFGRALGAQCDFNGDGLADLAIGAPETSTQNGGVFVYSGSPSGPVLARNLAPPHDGRAYFGGAVARAGATAPAPRTARSEPRDGRTSRRRSGSAACYRPVRSAPRAS